MNERELRVAIIATALKMNALGINQGKAGNVSARAGDGYLITPSGLPYDETNVDDIVRMDLTGITIGKRSPSSEWRFHQDIYIGRPEVNAIVHTHSPYATTLACMGLEVPAFHYMVAVTGGKNIRCAPYATFGTQALSDHAVAALQDRKACLLANHGLIAIGSSLKTALALAVEVEALCGQYWRVLQVGKPVLLSDAEMDVVLEKFRTYGQAGAN
jgi:L-fuculose-phosphate aldolase